jgi:hypothetical protein
MMVEKELQAGLLVTTAPPVLDGSVYYLLSDMPFEQDVRKVAFLAWLTQQL